MGIEVRKVPAGWQHPKDPAGKYISLLKGSYLEIAARWDEHHAQFRLGLCDDGLGGWKRVEPRHLSKGFEKYYGERPIEAEYMPDWPADEANYLMLYDDSQGSPLSPAWATVEELAIWLVQNSYMKFFVDGIQYRHLTLPEWVALIKDLLLPPRAFATISVQAETFELLAAWLTKSCGTEIPTSQWLKAIQNGYGMLPGVKLIVTPAGPIIQRE